MRYLMGKKIYFGGAVTATDGAATTALSVCMFTFLFFIFLFPLHSNAGVQVVNCPVSEIKYKCNSISASGCVKAASEAAAKSYCGALGKTYWDLGNSTDYGVNYPGTYLCSTAPTKGSFTDKCQATQSVANEPTSECASVSAEVRNNGSDSNPSYVCFCPKTGEQFYVSEIKPKSKTCKQEVATGNPELQDLKSCLDSLSSYTSSCATESSAASTKCDQTNKSNKEIDDAKNALTLTTQMMSALKAGSGAVKECMMAGAAALASKTALDALKDQCDEKTSTCQNSCDTNEFNNRLNTCYAKVSKVSEYSRQEAENIYQQAATEANKSFEAGLQSCKTSKVKQANLNNMLSDLMKTAQTGAACACQLSAAGTNCNASTGTLAVCAVGTISYNAQACECQMTGNASVNCRNLTTTAATTATGFDGPTLSSTPANGFGTTDGSGGSLNIGDIKDTSATDPYANKQGNKDMAMFAAPAGSGVGGGGGGPAPSVSGGGEGGAAEPEDKPTGLFGLAKNALNNLFGGVKPTKSNYKNARTGGVGQKGDFEKWRPTGLRSPASCDKSQIGCPNGQTIWQRMNRCSGNTKEKMTCTLSYLGPN